MQANFTMKDQLGNNHQLQQTEPEDSQETLGIFIAMDGNQD